MKSLKLWVTVVLVLAISIIVAAPREARAGKSFGITKTQYIKSLNNWLSKKGLRFEKSTIGNVYSLNSDSSGAFLSLPASGQLDRVELLWIKNTDSDEFNFVTTLCVIFAVEPNLDTTTSKTSDLFHKKWQDKMDQGLNKFSFEMGNKQIDVEIIKKGDSAAGISITITRP